MGLAIQLNQAAPAIVLKLQGELDYTTAPNLEAQLPRLLVPRPQPMSATRRRRSEPCAR